MAEDIWKLPKQQPSKQGSGWVKHQVGENLRADRLLQVWVSPSLPSKACIMMLLPALGFHNLRDHPRSLPDCKPGSKPWPCQFLAFVSPAPTSTSTVFTDSCKVLLALHSSHRCEAGIVTLI